MSAAETATQYRDMSTAETATQSRDMSAADTFSIHLFGWPFSNSNRRLTLSVRATDTIADIKQKLRAEGAAGQFYLVSGSRNLYDVTFSLSQYNIKQGAIMHVLPGTRPCRSRMAEREERYTADLAEAIQASIEGPNIVPMLPAGPPTVPITVPTYTGNPNDRSAWIKWVLQEMTDGEKANVRSILMLGARARRRN